MFNKILKIARIVKHKDYLHRNTNISFNDKVIIIGNGPSINDVNLFDFKRMGIELCCVNAFAAESEHFYSLKPKYYCAIDPDYYRTHPLDPDGNRKLYAAMEKVDWDIIFLCYSNQKLPITNQHVKYRFLPLTQEIIVPKSYRLYEQNLMSFRFQNVINACLYYFITGHAKQIYMIGIESDWHKELIVDENNIVYRKKQHFYGKHLENVTESGLIGKGELYKYFEYYAMTLKCFYLASKYAEFENVKVINLNLNSYVDCFDKQSIGNLLGGNEI